MNGKPDEIGKSSGDAKCLFSICFIMLSCILHGGYAIAMSDPGLRSVLEMTTAR